MARLGLRRLPFYYGWIIAVAATVGTLMSLPGQTVGVSVFTDSLITATGVSRTHLSHTYLAGTLLSALSLPAAGRFLDRHGARTTAFLAALGIGLTLVFLGSVDRLVKYLGGSYPLALSLLTLGFYALRLSGQGTLTMVSRTMLGRWFDRRRGLVAGVTGVFVGFGFGYAPRLFDDWIAASGWRGAWLQMGLAEVVIMGSVALLFFRSDPESCGLTLEGRASAKTADSNQEPGPEAEYTRGEAVRTLAFWTVTLALASQALVITAVTFHIVDIGALVGLTRSESVAIFFPLALTSTFVGLVAGVFGDRCSVRLLILVMMSFQALGLVGAADLSERSWLAAVGLGAAGGFFGPLSTLAFPRFFGRKNLGAIAGVEMMCLVIGSALGPSVYALFRELSGSYRPAVLASLILPISVAVLSAFFRRPPPTPGGRPASETEGRAAD